MADVPRTVLPYGFESTLTYLPKRRTAFHSVVELWETYRFHPLITWLLSHTFYGGKLFINIIEGDRPLLIDAPLYQPTPQVSLVFLHQVSDDERDDISNSKHNPRHTSDPPSFSDTYEPNYYPKIRNRPPTRLPLSVFRRIPKAS